jgi:hypothetical protein
MKILFYSSYHATPHIETELEIATQLMNQGHEVIFLRCLKQLNTCFANPEHTYFGCKVCISKISRAYNRINVHEKNMVSFPEVIIDVDQVYDANNIKNINDLKNITYKGWDLGMAVTSSLVSIVRDHEPDVNYYKNYIRKGIETAVFVYESGHKLINEIKPDEVYLFNGRFLEVRPFMRLCEERSIKFYTHERGGVLKNYMLREKSIPHSLVSAKNEIEALWQTGGEEKEAIGRKFFEDRRNRVIQGWHSFTKGQEYNKLPAGFDTLKNNIAIFNSSMDEYEGIAEHKSGIYENDNTGIEKILSSFKDDKDKHFYLRVHPNLKNLHNTQTKGIEAIRKKYTNVTVINADDDVDTYELMNRCDKVIVFGSTAGIEAVYWNKPVILLSRAFYDSLDCLYKPATHQEVLKLVSNTVLKAFNQQESLKYGYWILSMGVPYKLYRASSVGKGVFNDKRLIPHFFWRALYIIENTLKNAKA